MTAKHIQEAWDKLRQERDELAAQVEAMHSTVDKFINGIRDSICSSGNDARTNLWYVRKLKNEFALPNSAAAILRQRDARTLREAADIADQWGDARTDGQGGHALRNYAARIRNMAAELERKPLRDMTEADFNEAHGG